MNKEKRKLKLIIATIDSRAIKQRKQYSGYKVYFKLIWIYLIESARLQLMFTVLFVKIVR